MSRTRPNENGFAVFEWFSRSKPFHRWHTTKPVLIDFGEEDGFWRVCKFDPSTNKGVTLLVDRTKFAAALVNGDTDFSKNGGPVSRL